MENYVFIAEGKDFVVASLNAADLNGVVDVWFDGLEEGMIIKANTEVAFSLVSELPASGTLQWTIGIEGLGIQFVNTITFSGN